MGSAAIALLMNMRIWVIAVVMVRVIIHSYCISDCVISNRAVQVQLIVIIQRDLVRKIIHFIVVIVAVSFGFFGEGS